MTKIEIKDFIDAAELKKDLAYSDIDLTSAMMCQPALFARYGCLAADASAQVDVIKLLLENAESKAYKRERDRASLSDEKITEGMLNNIVARDKEVISLKIALNKAKRVENVAKIAVEGFRHRRDMLIQHGLIEREEMKGEIRIMEKKTKQEEIENVRKRELERLQSRNE